ncbi:hypothetical protein LTR28_005344 [Elasticomyces elasticus]|nr:hypothetical protein LTR28_005344 [Elasticomyces elasticus]
MLQTHHGTTPATQHFADGKGFLSTFDNSTPPKLYWIDEGFDVTHLHFNNGGPRFKRTLQSLGQGMGLGENFAMPGDAASEVSDTFSKLTAKLCALVAYYPSAIPAPGMKFPGSHDRDAHDKIADRLAWTRCLATVRKGFGAEVELEKIWEEHVELEFSEKDAKATVSTMVAKPYVNHIKTLTGGIGAKDSFRFYVYFFIPSNPPSLNTRLISRTIGVDRIVDEMVLSFKYTQPLPRTLPCVPSTHIHVEVALVSVVCIRGGKPYHECIYLDQASVLVQIGLLDPKVVPKSFKGKVDRGPAVGREAARKVLNEESEPSNEIISGVSDY